MEEADVVTSRNIYWPGMDVWVPTWRASQPHFWFCFGVSFSIKPVFCWVFFFVSLPVCFLFFLIYITSQKTPMIWRRETQGFDQALPYWQRRVEPCLNNSWLSSNVHSRGEHVNPKHVILASHLPPQPKLRLVSGRLQVQRNAKNRL